MNREVEVDGVLKDWELELTFVLRLPPDVAGRLRIAFLSRAHDLPEGPENLGEWIILTGPPEI